VKYVLLLGEGRNGKSTLMKMLSDIFGRENVSNVTRQAISEQNPMVLDLNGKLLNLVYDGMAEYLKDSGTEKSLIAGEPVSIRRLYESTATEVRTNALFIEGLNHEPKTKDKSTALQKRLVRFHFPNVYPLSHQFEKMMRSEKMLGALLSLLVDRYVTESSLAIELAPTTKAIELQLEAMYTNSVSLQFLKHLEDHDALGAAGLIGSPMSDLVQKFQSWRVHENDLGTWAEPDVIALFNPLLATERRSQRTASGVRKVRFITSFKTEASAFVDSLKGDHDDAEVLAALVDD
jgi:phage/plasmid-associated DNA primase